MRRVFEFVVKFGTITVKITVTVAAVDIEVDVFASVAGLSGRVCYKYCSDRGSKN